MLRLLADHNFDERILRGVLRVLPELDVERIRHVLSKNTSDPEILAWAAGERKVVISHDVATMRDFAYEHVAAGLPMPGLFLVPDWLPFRQAIDEIATLAGASDEGEWEGQVRYLPLR